MVVAKMPRESAAADEQDVDKAWISNMRVACVKLSNEPLVRAITGKTPRDFKSLHLDERAAGPIAAKAHAQAFVRHRTVTPGLCVTFAQQPTGALAMPPARRQIEP